jgi:hypothetical protein
VAGGGVVESVASADAREEASEVAEFGVEDVERCRRKGDGDAAAAAEEVAAPHFGAGRSGNGGGFGASSTLLSRSKRAEGKTGRTSKIGR